MDALVPISTAMRRLFSYFRRGQMGVNSLFAGIRRRWCATLALLPAALLLMAPAQAEQQSRIVGGTDAPAGVWTWQVSIGNAGSGVYAGHFCGGSVVAARWIVTAAHCVVDKNGTAAPGTLQVTAGTNDLNTGGVTVTVSAVHVHPKFDLTTMVNDIALLNLSQDLTCVTTTCQPVALMDSQSEASLASVGTSASVTGWGTQSYGATTYPNLLQQVEVPIVSDTSCANAYPNSITTEMVCAGYTAGGKDSCQGDSGGPLVVLDTASSTYRLTGVVSWGNQCALANYPGIYTRVSSYKCWVDQKVSGSTCTDGSGTGATVAGSTTNTTTGGSASCPFGGTNCRGGGPMNPFALIGLSAVLLGRRLRKLLP